MLIGTSGIWVAHDYLPMGNCSAHTIGHDAVIGKISSANHISCSSGRYRDFTIGKETALVAMSHQFGARLRVGVWIKTIEQFILAITPSPLPVEIHLVGRDIQERAHRWALSQTLHHVNRSHDIGLIGITRLLIAVTDNRLSSKMHNDLGTRILKRLLQVVKVADITDHRMADFIDSSDLK